MTHTQGKNYLNYLRYTYLPTFIIVFERLLLYIGTKIIITEVYASCYNDTHKYIVYYYN